MNISETTICLTYPEISMLANQSECNTSEVRELDTEVAWCNVIWIVADDDSGADPVSPEDRLTAESILEKLDAVDSE